jgi:hypothetical protein
MINGFYYQNNTDQKAKNATDSTDSTDSRSLADDALELEGHAQHMIDHFSKSVKSVAFLF